MLHYPCNQPGCRGFSIYTMPLLLGKRLLGNILLITVNFAAGSCKNAAVKHSELLFWCSNNNQEITLCNSITGRWNDNNTIKVHMQPIPEGQSSEEVILAAVVGKTTPDMYANMWQGTVEMYAHAGVLVALD